MALPCGCDPCLEGGYGDDGRSGRYSMEWCPTHALAEEMAAALQRVAGLLNEGPVVAAAAPYGGGYCRDDLRALLARRAGREEETR